MKQFKERAQEVRLSENEKRTMRSVLVALTESQPAKEKTAPGGITSGLASFRLWRTAPRLKASARPEASLRLSYVAAALLLLFLAGGGISYAAEGSLPGDILYPVKIHVNEQMRTNLIFSPKAKAGWEAERAGRRLAEAEELAAAGRLTAETKTELETDFESQAGHAGDLIAELKTTDDVNAAAEESSQFESMLAAHQWILGELASTSDAHGAIEPILEKIRVEVANAKKTRVRSEQEISSSPDTAQGAAEGKLKTAGERVREVQQFIAANGNALGLRGTADANAHLRVANGMIEDGKTKLSNGSPGEAFGLFQNAERVADRAQLIMDAKKNLHVDISIDGGDSENKMESVSASSSENGTPHDATPTKREDNNSEHTQPTLHGGEDDHRPGDE